MYGILCYVGACGVLCYVGAPTVVAHAYERKPYRTFPRRYARCALCTAMPRKLVGDTFGSTGRYELYGGTAVQCSLPEVLLERDPDSTLLLPAPCALSRHDHR